MPVLSLTMTTCSVPAVRYFISGPSPSTIEIFMFKIKWSVPPLCQSHLLHHHHRQMHPWFFVSFSLAPPRLLPEFLHPGRFLPVPDHNLDYQHLNLLIRHALPQAWYTDYLQSLSFS